jgi:DNA-3-methyladenine glycosylase
VTYHSLAKFGFFVGESSFVSKMLQMPIDKKKLPTRNPKSNTLQVDFFERTSIVVARELIGKLLIVTDPKTQKKWVSRIVETEAYRTDDPASHSSRGRTKRSAPMFEKPAHAYIYFIYGMYTMLNFVCEPEGTPGAVLIRALEPISGFGSTDHHLLNGPGKLCRELKIKLDDNRKPILKGRFIVKDDGILPDEILVTPRVGIREEEPFKPWRFIWSGHPCVSRAQQNRHVLRRLS